MNKQRGNCEAVTLPTNRSLLSANLPRDGSWNLMEFNPLDLPRKYADMSIPMFPSQCCLYYSLKNMAKMFLYFPRTK